MSDIRSVYIDLSLGIDYVFNELGLEEDDTLTTAVVLSLFTDRRANASDLLNMNSTDLRGWWADTYPDIEGDLIGSRLWLVNRSKQLPEVMADVKAYCEEALFWLVTDGVAKEVVVKVTNPRMGVLAAQVDIYKPDGNTTQFKFENLWSNF